MPRRGFIGCVWLALPVVFMAGLVFAPGMVAAAVKAPVPAPILAASDDDDDDPDPPDLSDDDDSGFSCSIGMIPLIGGPLLASVFLARRDDA